MLATRGCLPPLVNEVCLLPLGEWGVSLRQVPKKKDLQMLTTFDPPIKISFSSCL